MTRSCYILSLVHEAEGEIHSYDIPRKMVHLFLFIPLEMRFSLIDLREFLHRHGLNRYQEHLTNHVQEFQSKREFEFVFPRSRLEDVRYFSHILGSLLSDTFPTFIPHEIEQWGGLSGIFRISFSTNIPRLGRFHSPFMTDIPQQRRFFRNIHKKDWDSLDIW